MLPDWAYQKDDGVYVIDGDAAYPALLEELAGLRDSLNEAPEVEPDHVKALRAFDDLKIDQYWLEVVYQMAKLDLRRALLLSGESAWPAEIRIKSDKATWRIADYPAGRGVEAATKGKEARRLYQMLRGFIPN